MMQYIGGRFNLVTPRQQQFTFPAIAISNAHEEWHVSVAYIGEDIYNPVGQSLGKEEIKTQLVKAGNVLQIHSQFSYKNKRYNL